MTAPAAPRRTTLWLDVGGVLFRNVVEESPFLDELAEHWGIPAGQLRERYVDAQEDGLEAGRGRLADLWRRLRGRDADVRDHATAAALYLRSLHPHAAAWSFARAAAARYALYLTNNEIGEWDALREHAFPSTTIARGKISSFQIGVAKPSPLFFHTCLERLGVRPEEVVYFDDDAECVAAARMLRIDAHLWTGAADARARLEMAAEAGGPLALEAV